MIELPKRRVWTASTDTGARGVNVAGYLSADSGLAVSARRTITALEAAGVSVQPVNYRRTMSRQDLSDDDPYTRPLYNLSVVCVTAEQFPFFRADVGPTFFEGRYTIGYWYWELETFPEDQLVALDYVDEVWVATQHVLGALTPITAKPIRHMPIPLLVPQPSGRSRASFGLGDGYTFLFVFDFDSVMERKNPLATVTRLHAGLPESPDRIGWC